MSEERSQQRFFGLPAELRSIVWEFCRLELGRVTVRCSQHVLSSPDGPSAAGHDTEDEQDDLEPVLRLVETNDPAAYNLSGPQYSAHKMPKEVVDAASSGSDGLREFLTRWRDLTRGQADGMWDSYAE